MLKDLLHLRGPMMELQARLLGLKRAKFSDGFLEIAGACVEFLIPSSKPCLNQGVLARRSIPTVIPLAKGRRNILVSCILRRKVSRGFNMGGFNIRAVAPISFRYLARNDLNT